MANPLYKKGFFTTGGGGTALPTPYVSGQYLTSDGTNLSWAANGMGDLLANGSVPLTANWAAGAYDISAQTFTTTETLGVETMTTFASWTAAAGWTYGAGTGWTHSSGTTALEDDKSDLLTTNTLYKFVIGVTFAGTGSVTIGTASRNNIGTITATGSYTYYIVSIADDDLLTFTPTTGFTGAITSVSIKAVTGGTVTAGNASLTKAQLKLPTTAHQYYPTIAFGSTLGFGITATPEYIKMGVDTTGGLFTRSGYVEVVENLSAATSDQYAFKINYEVDKLTSGADTGLYIRRLDSSSPGSSYFIQCADVDTGNKFLVADTGAITCAAITSGATDGTAGGTLTVNPTLGAELITNFAGWTDVADWAYGSAKWHHDATGTTSLVSDWQPTANIKYKIVIVNATTTAGSGCVLTVGGQSYTMTVSGASNTDTFYLTAISTAALTFVPATDWHGDIVSCSVMAETNGALTATTGTFTNGLTVNSGQSLFPIRTYGSPSISSPTDLTTGLCFDGSGSMTLSSSNTPTLYINNNGLWQYAGSFYFGSMADVSIKRVSAGGLGVVEQQITAGAGTGLTVVSAGHLNRQVYKVTVDYTGFSAAALTADHTIATLPAKTKIVGFYADTTVPFTGGTVSAAALTVGKSAGGVEYIATHDVLSAAIMRGLVDADMGTELTRAAAIQGGAIMNWTGTTTVSARLTTVTANTNALTAGSVTFYIVTERY